jgi:hypothetical protein
MAAGELANIFRFHQWPPPALGLIDSASKLMKKKKLPLKAIDPLGEPGELKRIGGSQSDIWNNLIVGQVVQTLWTKNSDPEERKRQYEGTISALIAMSPQDEIEGMVATQLIAAHNASMECFRRAMIGEQTFEGRRENLNQANKLSRTYSALLEALNRYRGKGQQKVTVEHVHVHQGGQAIVGNVRSQGGGLTSKPEEQPHALGHATSQEMRRADAVGGALPFPRDEQRPMQDARGNFSRSTQRE